MISRKDVKVEGGKLLRVEVEIVAGSVVRASVCGECHEELGKDTILMAAESLKAQLQDALGESRYFGLEEWIA